MEEKINRYKVFSFSLDYYFLFIITLILSIIGVVMISSASIAIGERYFNDPYWFIRRQVISWVASFAILIIVSRIDYKKYRKLSKFIILIVIGLLALVLIPGMGTSGGGARRWINLWFFNPQPSEFAKIALVLFFSDYLSRKYIKEPGIKNLLWPSFFVLFLITVLIFLEPDLSTAVVIWLVVFAVLFVGNVRIGHILGMGLMGMIITTGYMFLEEYRRERIIAFFSGTSDSGGASFQTYQSLVALGSGSLTGLGLGNSVQKYSYLPEAQTDFIFAIVGEEFGLMGTLIIVFLFCLFLFFGIRVCLKTEDYFGRNMAAGLTAMVMVQAVINISVVVGLVPVTGLTLPFISYGGSSLLVNMTAVGILLNISRQNLLVKRVRRNLKIDMENEED
ncbi:MAG: putative lipid II flippase FtsW [Actinobacteria bacterium]|nr:putative lipid II flippase FtsW [Actinomycetota bacterium]